MSVAAIGIGGAISAGIGIAGLVMGADAAGDAQDAQGRSLASQETAAARQAALAEKQDARSQDQWDRYKATYQPLEDQMIDEAKGVGSVANQNKAASDAAASTAATFATARQRLSKNPGVNPSSQQYLQQESQIGLAEAANSAASQTGAREAVKDRGTAALTNAVSLGKGLPASAVTAGQSAGAIMGSAGVMYEKSADDYRKQGDDAAAGISSFAKGAAGIFGSKGVQDWMNSTSTPGTSASSYGAYPSNSGYDPSQYTPFEG
jgi:hypothetical protein